MSLALTRRIKDLEEVVRQLDARVLLLEMQKRPVEAIASPAPVMTPRRETISLRGRAA